MNNASRIYLDYCATTPVDPEVLESMLPYFTEKFGNASSVSHVYGWDAEEAVAHAREQVAELISARPAEIYFTSGATEAISLALLGACNTRESKGNHIITCVTEHKAVLDTCKELEKRGFELTYLKVDEEGNINLNELKEAITAQTILISLMHANNESGVIHSLAEVADLIKGKEILLMTDATQSVGKIPFDVNGLGVDLATISAHKLYGPKGAGALYVRKSARASASPILFGGGQEKGLRPGTLNVPGIAGFGKACEICNKKMKSESHRLQRLRDHLEKEIQALGGVKINGRKAARLPHVTNLSFQDIDGSKLIRALKNLAVSQGSACTSGTVEPSHVLSSMGHSLELALSSIRIALGRFTTKEEIDTATETITRAVKQLRMSLK